MTVKSCAISGWGPTTSMLSMLSLAAGPYNSQRNYPIPTVSIPFSVRVVDHNSLNDPQLTIGEDSLTCYYASTFADILDLPMPPKTLLQFTSDYLLLFATGDRGL